MAPSITRAQSTYDKEIKGKQIVAPLGLDVGGESINYFTGSTSFQATDLSLPGNNGLSVKIGRVYAVESERTISQSGAPHNIFVTTYNRPFLFGDWDLDIPHIAATFSGEWVVDTTTPLNRCSVIGQVDAAGNPATGRPPNSMYHLVDEFFHGYTLVTDAGSDVLLLADIAETPRPTSGGAYHWTTPKNWWVSCLPTIQNGDGEGFLAVSPAGVKYYFDWMSARVVGVLSDVIDLGNGKSRNMFTYLKERWMLPTRVEDRFGNWVKYSYSDDSFARLTSISSSDGRSIALQYDEQGHIIRAIGGGKVVNYSYQPVYAAESLSAVSLPDGSTWDYNFANTFYMQLLPSYSTSDPCARPTSPPYGDAGPAPPLSSFQCVGWPKMIIIGQGERTISVKTPSNAFVEYVFNPHFQLTGAGGYMHSYPIGLSKKTISGPGFPARTWQYSFGPDIDVTRSQCLAGACPVEMWTEETNSDGAIIKRTFGLQFDSNQGLLTHEFRGVLMQGNPVFQRDSKFLYHVGAPVGHRPAGVGTFQVLTERRLPLQSTMISQQGRVFTQEVASDCYGTMYCFDMYDRPTKIIKSSTP